MTITNKDILDNFADFVDELVDLEEERLPQRAYAIIRHAIKNLILPPGHTVLEREVAEVLDMSRTPIREALVRLENDGAVKLIPRRGFYIEPIERSDLSDVYQLSAVLDGLAIELATPRLTENHIKELESLLNQQKTALKNKEYTQWAILDDKFHQLITDQSANESLKKTISIYSDKLYKARLYTIQKRTVLDMSILEHQAIIACLKARDSKAAKVLMESHRKRAQEEILHALANFDS